ncbi:GNAT family N-acetyltransferase [Dongia deserti]|uniref:GNAT family N-acetyltransferase n=1 Tax=Dongia deserti TaxID=2268030 RepID=UPI0013C42132|nr:GNAT family N-acetyltransferase [Dongia deserti]
MTAIDDVAECSGLEKGLVVAASPSFNFGSAEYRTLFQRANCSAFQHPDWLTAFYISLVQARCVEPVVVIGRWAETGRLAFVVPLLKRKTGGSTVVEYASLGVTDYALPIVCPTLLATGRGKIELARAFLQAAGSHDAIRIAPVPPHGLTAWEALIGEPPVRLGFGAHEVKCDRSFADWYERTRSPRRRADVRRKIRRLATAIGPLRLEVIDRTGIRDVFAAARCFREGRFADDPLQQERFFEFYVDVATRGAASGFSRTYRLSAGGETVAVLFGIIHRNRFCYLVLGADYVGYGKYSPGTIMFDRVMEHWFDGGGQIFDFTIGDEAFKAGFGCSRSPMHEVVRMPMTGMSAED